MFCKSDLFSDKPSICAISEEVWPDGASGLVETIKLSLNIQKRQAYQHVTRTYEMGHSSVLGLPLASSPEMTRLGMAQAKVVQFTQQLKI